MDSPEVSVVLSIYRNTRLAFFKEAIESLLYQSFKKYEIILVIDGEISSDIQRFLTKLIRQYKHLFRIIQNPENKGLAYSLNYGIQVANGSFIIRMDDDEICMPERIALQYKTMVETGCDICFTNAYFIDEKGSYVSRLYSDNFMKSLKSLLKTPDKFLKQLTFDNFIMHPTVSFRKDRMKEIDFYDSTLPNCEDIDLWIRALVHGFKFEFIDIPLVKIRVPEKKNIKDRIKKIKGYYYWHSVVLKRHKKAILDSLRRPIDRLLFKLQYIRFVSITKTLQFLPLQILYLIVKLRDFFIGYRTERK